jgi:hypothetical protein
MAQSKNIKTHEFDSLVIGGGLAGLITANQLEHTGRKVALIEGLDTLGGSNRPTMSAIGLVDHGLKFLPDAPQAIEAIEWLQTILGEKIEHTSIDAPPVIYDDGKFKPFIGFGDQKVATASEIAAYATSRYLQLSSTPKNWIPKLTDSFAGTVLMQSLATKMQVDDEFVIEVLINGSKRISAREVIFCATPQQLTRLLPETHVPGRLRQKLMKGEFWTSLSLDLLHKGHVTESPSIHVLKGANEEPCVGLFQPPTKLEDGTPAQLSQWLTFVPRDITDDSETVASALKQIKRQVKRAYETSLDGLLKERIVVGPTSHGELIGALPEDGRWPKLQNLWVVSSFADPAKNLLGSLLQTRRTIGAIAGDPITSVDLDSDLAEGSAIPFA